jgi:hypothetical protein
MVCLLLTLCWGCGTGAYEKLLSEREGKAWDKKYVVDFSPEREVPGTPFLLRMPKLFATPFCENGKTADGKSVDRRRSEPGELGLPPASLTYEMPIPDQAGGKQSSYCYMMVESVSKTGNLAKVSTQLQSTLTAMSKAPDSGFEGPLAVGTIRGNKRDGQITDWTEIRYVGKMNFFYIDKGGKEQYQPMPGVLRVYLHEEAGFLVAFVMRMPKSVDQLIKGETLPKAISLLVSSIRMKS